MKRLLVANRGEIARRVIRTAQAMGISTVAVYSDADRNALHVREATTAVALGGTASADSYLRIDKLIAAALTSGADAVHPGYGFLSENADFAQAVLDAGLVWVGPPPAAIRALGSKRAAKQLALAHGVPVLPGYQGDDQRDERFVQEAAAIGYPVMVKASAGGGGRGMRLVHEAAQLPAALASARSEAVAAFGSGELLIERALLDPRHVEVQIFADAHGHCVHLGERDCSVQRRHQKIIEEAPGPAVGPALRERLGACAVALAQAAGYVGAGTVEFLLEGDKGRRVGPPQARPAPWGGSEPREAGSVGAFYLMEMNTRLQVEHPVTEMITGLDLVEWQLRVARGEALPLAQDGIRFSGHAIEVRLCAEDESFTPHTGRVERFDPPSACEGLRFDHAIETGLVVSPHYDAMLGKLIAHAPTREAAIDSLAAALDRLVLLGLPSNRALLAAVLRHPAFRAGDATIGFMGEHGDAIRELLLKRELKSAIRCWLEAVLMPNSAPTALPFPVPRPARLRHRGRVHDVAASPGESSAGLVAARLPDGRVHLLHDGVDAIVADASYDPPETTGGGAGADLLRAPFNGKVIGLPVAVGHRVLRGQPLVVVESMKLEHQLAAPRDATVAAVEVAAGQQVAPGQPLLRFTPQAAA